MDTSPEQIESLNKNIEQFERKARRRAWLSTVIPLLFGVFLLGFTIWQIQISAQKLADVKNKLSSTSQELTVANAALLSTRTQLDQTNVDLATLQDKLKSTTTELEKTKEELDKINKELDEATQELKDANGFVANAYSINVLDLKGSFLDQFPLQEEVLFDIENLQYAGVGWNRNGFSESEGFNSPNFAVYVLQRHGLISKSYGGNARPWDILTPVSQPSIGDIVYYEKGYTMFYYEFNGEPFVTGMTPLGIISQKIYFAPILGYLHVPYQ